MENIAWSPDLNIGIEVIDNQHRRIVNMLNQLNDVRRAHQPGTDARMGAVGDVIAELVDYTLSHFAFEESLMEDASYQFYRAHKRVHDLFVKRVGEYQFRFQGGEDITDELHAMLSRWLVNHIRNDDAAYGPSIKASMDVDVDYRRPDGWVSRSLKRFFKELR